MPTLQLQNTAGTVAEASITQPMCLLQCINKEAQLKISVMHTPHNWYEAGLIQRMQGSRILEHIKCQEIMLTTLKVPACQII